jgi:cellulose synthase/poly-beta-1,6-N-acetylglucosamine synthase-like glycosyltransferase
MPQHAFCSFVVIAYNEEANIAATLSAIMELDDIGDYELIVVDDGSRDRTAQIVEDIAAQHPCIRLIRLGKNRGRGYARNEGVTRARGAFIATVDADIVLPPDWLVQARAALQSHDAVGGTALPDGDVAYLYRRFRLIPRLVGHTTAVTGSNALYKRQAFDVVGFDPTLRNGEDSALNEAMARYGLSVATVPGLTVLHDENKPFGVSLRWLFDIGRGATRQLLRSQRVRQPDVVAAAFFVSVALCILIALAGYAIVGVAVPLVFILLASVQHVRSRFYTPASHWPTAACAVAVDGALLTAYFLGRLVGLSALWDSNLRHPAPSNEAPS